MVSQIGTVWDPSDSSCSGYLIGTILMVPHLVGVWDPSDLGVWDPSGPSCSGCLGSQWCLM